MIPIFYFRLDKNRSSLCKWVGELYFELHQGTFTSQSEIKRLNNRMENLLRCAEFYVAVLRIISQRDSNSMPPELDIDKMRSALKSAWELVLCNQFHDVLPGSCIEEVARDAVDYFKRAENLIKFQFSSEVISCRVNLSQWSFDVQSVEPRRSDPLLDVVVPKVNLCLENEYLRAVFKPDGTLESLSACGTKQNLAAEGSPLNVFKIYSDMPLFWDAWDIMDYHSETGANISAVSHRIENGCIVFEFKISDNSKMSMKVSLPKCEPYLVFELCVDWQEAHKLLKVEFEFDLRAQHCSYGSQIGFVEQTNNMNTSQDTAKFEVCGHKWAAMQQYGYGCAVLTPAKYGFRALDSKLALSLLRAPKAPDDNCDMGNHSIKYALMPYVGTFQTADVQKCANDFNLNTDDFVVSIPKLSPQMTEVTSEGALIKVLSKAIRIESFQCAYEMPNAYVLKLSEQFGSSAQCNVALSSLLGMKKYALCDILERPLSEFADISERGVIINVKPFKLICILLIA